MQAATNFIVVVFITIIGGLNHQTYPVTQQPHHYLLRSKLAHLPIQKNPYAFENVPIITIWQITYATEVRGFYV